MTRPRWALLLAAMLWLATGLTADAHQPFYEDSDVSLESPWLIRDPSISLSLYASLDAPDDVDYFTFEGRAGQTLPIEILLPAIDAHRAFAPALALFGPGLPDTALPDRIARPAGLNAVYYPPIMTSATFFEPFSRSTYFWRQRQRVTLPQAGRYYVAVWHPSGQVGHYVLAIGDREIPGGDPQSAQKRARYWTPLVQPAPVAPASPAAVAPSAAPQDEAQAARVRAILERRLLNNPMWRELER